MAAHEQADPEVTARIIASQLAHMIDRADGASLPMLASLLDAARIEAEKAANHRDAPESGESPPPAAVSETEGIPLMITRRQRAQLRELGWSDERIHEMAPEEAHRHLNL